jgi:hypothetical protein
MAYRAEEAAVHYGRRSCSRNQYYVGLRVRNAKRFRRDLPPSYIVVACCQQSVSFNLQERLRPPLLQQHKTLGCKRTLSTGPAATYL